MLTLERLSYGVLCFNVFSSSSDEESEGNLSTGNQDFRKKRKRRMKEKMEYFTEGLVMRIMQKQEEMNKQLIEMIERREKERVIREEAWRQQENERVKRDEELRIQENSRNLALISFIQTILGQDIPIPIPRQPWTPNENISGQDVLIIPSGESNLSSLEGNGSKDQDIADADTVQRDGNKRWPEAEVRTLIMLRTGLQDKFGTVGSKCPVWDQISEEMRKMGYDRSGKKCKEKWENINKYFRRSVANGKKKEACRYFEDLDKLYQKNEGVDSQLGS